MSKKTYILESCEDADGWDSDYAGNFTMSLADAQLALAKFKARAKTDPEDCDLCTDGVSWAGWHFRIVACCCVAVSEQPARAIKPAGGGR